MALNQANTVPGQLNLTAGDGIDITSGVISNTMLPPSSILDNTITNPSTITDFGGAYIVPVGATGAWAGKDNQIATTIDNGVTWAFALPVAGMRRQVVGGTNAGTVFKWSGTAWEASVSAGQPIGTLLKLQSFYGAEIAASATASFTTTTLSVNYTPVSASSYLVVEADADYTIAGVGSDTWRGRVVVAGVQVYAKSQRFDASTGAGMRSSIALPIQGRYTNTSTAVKAVQILLERTTGDDTASLNSTNRVITVTEIQR